MFDTKDVQEQPADILAMIFMTQASLQREVFGHNVATMSHEQQVEYVRWNILALTDELHEALNEISWKPWATSTHFNREAFCSEMADALHFFVNLCLVAGISSQRLATAYAEKVTVNILRQQNHYDGISGKCQKCGRALDDPGILCTTESCIEDTP